MKPLPLQTLAAFCGGTLHGGDPARLASRVTTDSRQVQPGQVFVALKGDRFDGQAFVPAVAAAGAAAVVISEEVPGLPESCAAIRVADTLRALQRLAHEYRLWHRPRLIALTGSNGKTSTKDLSRAVLSRSFRVRATVGNLNNHIGLPLTLLSLEEGDEISLTEMGMNHAGEIRELVDIAQPDDAILTNVGHAHIEYFGSQDAIAWEKATLPANISRDGTVVLNAEDAYTPLIARHCQGRVLRAGIDAGEIRATDLQPDASGTRFTLHTPAGEATLRLPIPGRHMISNATLAAAIGWARGIAVADIAAALEEVTLTGGRLQTRQIRGVDFLDDSYNANPDSMAAGLRTLAEAPARRRIAVLGSMGELGQHSAEGHASVGRLAATLGLDALFTVGSGDAIRIQQAAAASGLADTQHFSDHSTCASHLAGVLQAGDLVLVKGSRTAAMERLFPLLNDA